VGPYTAGAILSIASDQVEPILDGNVERVLSRIRRVSREKGDVSYKARLWRISQLFVSKAHENGIKPSVLNQSLMELGAILCTPRKPQCTNCPLTQICRAAQSREQELYPQKKKPTQWISVQEKFHCLMNESSQILLRKRMPGEWRAGLWDLLEDSFLKTPPIEFWKMKEMGQIETRHVVTRHKIQRRTHVWRVQASQKSVGIASDLKWIPLAQLKEKGKGVPMGSALKKTLQVVFEKFSETSG
jgi:adenine-specific DNA glycosylase